MEFYIFFLVTLISVLFLFFINFKYSQLRFVGIVNFIFFCEAIVLTFFFDKYPLVFSFLLLIFSSYYFFNTIFSINTSLISNLDKRPVFPFNVKKYFVHFGLLLLIFVIIYTVYTLDFFSTTDFLVLVLSFLLIYYHKIPDKYKHETNFMIIFLSMLTFLFISPNIFYKIVYGYVGVKSEGAWIDEDFLVYYLLGNPLANFLSVMNYNVFAFEKYILFEDLNQGIVQQVSIAKSCAGITSIQIFSSALFSYLWLEYRRLSNELFIFLFLGIVVSYFANLFRMATIVLSGHYYGMDVFDTVHKSAGWLIFTFWIFIFWQLMDRIILMNKKDLHLEI